MYPILPGHVCCPMPTSDSGCGPRSFFFFFFLWIRPPPRSPLFPYPPLFRSRGCWVVTARGCFALPLALVREFPAFFSPQVQFPAAGRVAMVPPPVRLVQRQEPDLGSNK